MTHFKNQTRGCMELIKQYLTGYRHRRSFSKQSGNNKRKQSTGIKLKGGEKKGKEKIYAVHKTEKRTKDEKTFRT